MVKDLSANVYETRETQVQSPGREDPWDEEMATHSNILGRGIPWTEEPGGLQSMGSQRDMTELTHVHHDPHPTSSGDHTQALWQAAELGGVTLWQAVGLTPSARWRRGQGDAGRHLGPRERRGSEWSSHTGACFPHSGKAFPLSCSSSPLRHSQSGPYKPGCVLGPPAVS